MVYLQGKEIKDPQTGQSLGNMETPCGEVVITRVTPKLSYGVLENVSMDLTNVQPGALQVKEEITVSRAKAPAESSSNTDTTSNVTVTSEDAQSGGNKTKPKRQIRKVKNTTTSDHDDW